MTTLENKSSYLWTKHFPDKLYSILKFLYKKGNEAHLSEIKEEFKDQISKPVIKDIIFDLSMEGKIEEAPMKKDRRKKIIRLTENGLNLWHKLEELSQIM